jgi:hypothetical protein
MGQFEPRTWIVADILNITTQFRNIDKSHASTALPLLPMGIAALKC